VFLRHAAVAWLLIVSMLVGAMGMGVSVASAETCAASCPCDGPRAAEDEGDLHHDDASDADSHNCGPTDEDCPDDCPECGCCSGTLLAIMPLTAPSVRASYNSLTVAATHRAWPPGAAVGVYRPPRSSS
jgi:hypothetical protein